MKQAGQEALMRHISDQKFNESHWSYSVESLTIATKWSLTWPYPSMMGWPFQRSSCNTPTIGSYNVECSCCNGTEPVKFRISSNIFLWMTEEGKTFVTFLSFSGKAVSDKENKMRVKGEKTVSISRSHTLCKVFSFPNYIQAPYFIPSNPKSTVSY